MVFFINKQAIEIKSQFQGILLTSINECCCAVGILAKMYGLPMPKKFDTLKDMKEDILKQIDGRPVPSEYALKITNMLDGYFKPEIITNELYDLLQYAYNEQNGLEPAYKAPAYR
ncbi:DUF3837 family protein [Lacrimispora sp.]|jgi:hypothetical protein|uniref:DUF3837 family protein n=1 Tax=Lacrimispora sp. TaxID=2719234 RepID=UPI002896CD9E|nr:DUF3837 family protein [Lacrimispora sp.]